MRVQTVGNKYPQYLRQFYTRHPCLANRPYVEQHAALMADSFGGAEIWATGLKDFGYATSRIIANAERAQKRWALENGLAYDEPSWLLEIVEAQVKTFRPDVLFYSTLPASFLRHLKSICPTIRLVFGWCGAPYKKPAVFDEVDVVLSNIPEMVQHFRENGHYCYHLNHGFDARVLSRIDTEHSPNADFAFLGSITKAPGFHSERERLMLELVGKTDLEIWAHIPQPSLRERAKLRIRQRAYEAVHVMLRMGIPRSLLEAAPGCRKVVQWPGRPNLGRYVDRRIARRARPPLFGVRMFQQLRDSRIALNTHIDLSSLSASNMRLYEATGVGTCLLTDWKPNLPDLFEPDVEVVPYRNAEDCVEKVRYLLDHEGDRKDIASAGQQRTLKQHTIQHRAAELHAIIQYHWQNLN